MHEFWRNLHQILENISLSRLIGRETSSVFGCLLQVIQNIRNGVGAENRWMCKLGLTATVAITIQSGFGYRQVVYRKSGSEYALISW